MTLFSDGKQMAEIRLTTWTGSGWGPDFEMDFFNVGRLEFDEDKDVYKVKDVDYLIEQARDYIAGIGDFCDCKADDGTELIYDIVDV